MREKENRTVSTENINMLSEIRDSLKNGVDGLDAFLLKVAKPGKSDSPGEPTDAQLIAAAMRSRARMTELLTFN
jgi:hypothetical protein